MIERPAAEQAAGLETRYAQVRFGHLRMLLPQNDVRSVEPIMDVDTTQSLDGEIGRVNLAGTVWPVYSFDPDLQLTRPVPADHRVCVLISGGAGGFGITCSELTTVASAEIQRVPVPRCMRSPGPVLESLAVLDGAVACVIDASGLAGLIHPPDPQAMYTIPDHVFDQVRAQ